MPLITQTERSESQFGVCILAAYNNCPSLSQKTKKQKKRTKDTTRLHKCHFEQSEMIFKSKRKIWLQVTY